MFIPLQSSGCQLSLRLARRPTLRWLSATRSRAGKRSADLPWAHELGAAGSSLTEQWAQSCTAVSKAGVLNSQRDCRKPFTFFRGGAIVPAWISKYHVLHAKQYYIYPLNFLSKSVFYTHCLHIRVLISVRVYACVLGRVYASTLVYSKGLHAYYVGGCIFLFV